MADRSRTSRRDWQGEEQPWLLGAGVVRAMKNGRAGERRSRRPFIVETHGERHLLFSHDSVQSTMKIDDPDGLACEYTRRMMSFLLFAPEPREIVMIGLGGGSLAKFCYRHLRDARITTVEIDADVIALRDEFAIPLDDARFQVIHADGARYLAQRSEPIDVLIVDAFDELGVAPSLATSEFYKHASRTLAHDGVLVMNMSGEQSRYDAHLQRIYAAFGDLGFIAPVRSSENDLLFAFKSAPRIGTSELQARAASLQRRLGLVFSALRALARVGGRDGVA